MPEAFRETAKGGLANTPTGRNIMKELKNRAKRSERERSDDGA